MENPSGEPVLLDKEDLLKRQRQEKKELQNKIQGMKKSIPKGDKQKKKEITEEISRLEKELDNRHNEELNGFKEIEADNCIEPTAEEPEDDEVQIDKTAPKMSRAQKRRNKKESEAKEREKRIQEQAEKNREGPRFVEMTSIKNSLKEIDLQIHNIPADGNCLYLAVKHQLTVSGRPSYSVTELRKKTANYMREHKDDFLPFMYNEDDDSEMSEEGFESYCKEVEKTKLWGGQLELKALSNIIGCPIKVIQANGPPTVQGETFKGPELILTYHRHLYRLGEHYNSTLPLVDEENDV
ncbi:deubiquitinase OTUD6B [Anthonomus grandis grandis]|uniref:deubiquitinase OTUD6B n=1 Tax=Anthonomus grandis grandis TaxID=2921223 RepID=UPI002165EEB7|nr:deubiquitinase OTUD6B [Anthonomus grandis grandis]